MDLIAATAASSSTFLLRVLPPLLEVVVLLTLGVFSRTLGDTLRRPD